MSAVAAAAAPATPAAAAAAAADPSAAPAEPGVGAGPAAAEPGAAGAVRVGGAPVHRRRDQLDRPHVTICNDFDMFFKLMRGPHRGRLVFAFFGRSLITA